MALFDKKEQLDKVLHSNQWNIKAVAHAYSVTPVTIYKYMQKFGIRKNNKWRTPEGIAKLRALFKKHDGNISAMAIEAGISRQGMYDRLKRLNIEELRPIKKKYTNTALYKHIRTNRTKFIKSYKKFRGNYTIIASKVYETDVGVMRKCLKYLGLFEKYPPLGTTLKHSPEEIRKAYKSVKGNVHKLSQKLDVHYVTALRYIKLFVMGERR